MTTISHSDPWVLEGELLERIARAKAHDPFAPILVVVPTSRLADHVQRRIAVRLGAAIGIDVLTHRALALRILAASGRPARVADASIEDALLDRVVERAPRGRLRDFVRERPAARPSLAATLVDLRDAGVDPAALPAIELRDLYTRWTRAWQGLPLFDEAGLAAAATPHAAAFGRRYAAILHHGTYELTGVNDDLVRALDGGREGVTLLPLAGEELVSGWRGKEIRFADAQGARAELMLGVSTVLARVAAGEAPHEQAVVVRFFGPYASAVEALLLDDRVRWHTSFASSLRRQPEVAAALAGLAASGEGPSARWSAHAESMSPWLAGVASEAGARLSAILEAMRSLENDLGETREVSAAEALAFLTARLDATTVAPVGHAGGGPRLLDAMQARGMTFDHVALVGMNARVWPRVPSEDPFLSDELRRRLRHETGRPIPIHLDNEEEERLLLAMTLGSARRSIDVSWQRADDHGRPVVPSLALRAIARAAAEEVPRRSLPAHPRSRLETLARHPGVLRPEDEIVLVALAAGDGADAAAAVRARRPELAAGLEAVAATDSFDHSRLAYDGRVGAPREVRALSVSKLETLARCPLQFFFEVVLGIDAGDTADSPYESSRSKLGIVVHDALKEVYERLVAEARFDEPLASRTGRARELLAQAWADRTADFAATRARPLPVVDRVESELWRQTLEAFVTEDLERMEGEGQRPVALETRRTTDHVPELPPLTSRLDRILEGPAGRVVGDYKIGGKVEKKVGATSMLQGENLQVAVYGLLEDTPVDVLGVGRDHEVRFARFAGFVEPAVRDGIVETVRTIAGLAASGTFPMREGAHCTWCAYRSACRRGHPPSEFREEWAADTRDERDTRAKNRRQPTLAAVRAGNGS